MNGAESIAAARERLARGETSASELVERHLERAEAARSRGAFITIDEGGAREAAHRADTAARELGEGAFRERPLLGIPITVKDILASRGLRTTSGSTIFADVVPEEDAVALARLREAGAILIGKTNLHEFAYGVSNVNPHYGTAENPWLSGRISGGSSGGSAVALALGAGLGSIGTDTGGSIRIPSALCGVVGLKPTYGRVSRRGVTPLSWSLDHVGPMARTVEDVAILYDAMAGPDDADPHSVPERPEPTLPGLGELPGGLRLGIHERYFFDDLAPEVEESVRRAVGELESLGLSIVEIDVPEVALQTACRNVIAFAEASSFHEKNIRSRPEDYGEDTRELLRLGLLLSATDYLAALRTRRIVVEAFHAAFEKIDVFASPTTPAAAPPIGAKTLDNGEELRAGLLRLASPFDTTGFPALSLPCGRTTDGRPIGLQLAAGPRSEARLLQIAYAYEQSRGVREWMLS